MTVGVIEPPAEQRLFTWRPGVRLPREISAQQVGDEVTAIETEEGVCTPEALVDRERPENAPLHKCFNWDDPDAAERFRAMQARALIRSVVVVAANDDGEVRTAPAFVHVTIVDQHNGDRRDGYVATTKALATTSMREQVVEEALRLLTGVRRRYANLTEFSGVWEAVDEATAELMADIATEEPQPLPPRRPRRR